MNDLVRSRVYRTLRKMARYHYIDKDNSNYLQEAHLGILSGEEIIGFYRNSDNALEDIVITDSGIYVCPQNTWMRLAYEQIIKIHGPTDKRSDNVITVDLADGRSVAVVITGREGRSADVFEFLRFLKRVVEDQHIQSKT